MFLRGGSGYVTVWPSGIVKGDTSTLNFSAGQTIANSALVLLGSDGKIQFYNGSNGNTQILADVTGYVTAGAPLSAQSTVWTWGSISGWGPSRGFPFGGSSNTPVIQDSLAGVKEIVEDDESLDDMYHGSGYALKSDGTVLAWGDNASGQLGNNSTNSSSTPISVPGLSDVVHIAGGNHAAYAVKSDGTVWAWGTDLGNGTGDISLVPIKVPILTEVSAISHGGNGVLVRKTDGTVWTWGGVSYIPRKIVGLDNITYISDGYAIKSDGTVYSDLLSPTGPAVVSGLTGVKSISSNGTGYGAATFAVKQDGTVWAWGYNDKGQLGTGIADYSGSIHPTPVQIAGLTNVVASAIANGTGFALKSDGTVWGWGNTAYGRLQNAWPTPNHIAVPQQITNLSGITVIATGTYTYAIRP